MKNLFKLFIAATLLAGFSVPAMAETGVDLVSTDGAICDGRTEGKNVSADEEKKVESNGSGAQENG